MATSVPVPMAMPEVGQGQRRRVVDAVADHGDAVAGGLQRARSRATLSSGRTSATTRSTPTSPPTAWAVRSLSPVRSTTCRPSSCRAAIASALVGLTVSATTNSAVARAGGAPPGRRREHRRSDRPASASAAAASTSGATEANSERRPTATAVDPMTPVTPRPGRFSNVVDRHGARSTAPATARAIGCSDRCSSDAARVDDVVAVRPVVAGSAMTVSTRTMRPSVTVPVLSSTTTSICRVSSRTSPPLMMMPSCAARPVPDHDRGGRGQAERARAGDDQHGHRRAEGVRRRRGR